MPTPTPNQKIEQVKMFDGEYVELVLTGDTFDDAYDAATLYCTEKMMSFVHPFHDIKVIEGQATIALEILAQSKKSIDYLFLPVGGGGLAAGVSRVYAPCGMPRHHTQTLNSKLNQTHSHKFNPLHLYHIH